VAEQGDTHQEGATDTVYRSDFSHHMQESIHRTAVNCTFTEPVCITASAKASPLETINVTFLVPSAPWSKRGSATENHQLTSNCLVTYQHSQSGLPTAEPSTPKAPCHHSAAGPAFLPYTSPAVRVHRANCTSWLVLGRNWGLKGRT